ncbi:polysaccharide deacetylase family protein [Eubacterium oxidoreducens]|uniref:Peptidoglycan/xylan/chitin deacetylase, PgdA/CDA1 family n=1 Tax=Eubacterium oxidoreducens TaxID=1732 RepID=A0A1G6AP52_EUBOX|nr:polysaccharide deacetylase family protein [Eubacterium oxidoreducens]SDB10198.1 Peptidoglycan/xylan/chitin deacetylase, PgdA/CDA1 family [Eubacterium oxidoreducens]
MASNITDSNLKKNRDRRKRINRIKIGMLLTIFIWIIVSIILCVFLGIRVYSLKTRISDMENNLTVLEQLITTGEINYKTDSSGDDSASVSKGMETEDQVENMKVYLTFDDGPSDNTAEILDVLAEYDVKATFFVTGKTDSESKKLYKRIVDEGHTLGMHSYSHKYSEIYNSLDDFKADFTKIQNYLEEVTGVKPVYYRFPGGSSNQVSNTSMTTFISYLNEQGVTYFDWNVSSGDATSEAYSTEDIITNVMGDVPNYSTSIVLLHDSNNKSTTVDALPSLIEELQASDAQILPIDEDTDLVQHIYYKSVE